MINMIIFFSMFSMISLALIMINLMISKKSFMDREKISPFECGFDPMSNSRIPFSIQFFLISLIFLIFDVEITLLIPLIFLFFFMNITVVLSSMFFLMILIFGLFLEYLEESIEWKY